MARSQAGPPEAVSQPSFPVSATTKLQYNPKMLLPMLEPVSALEVMTGGRGEVVPPWGVLEPVAELVAGRSAVAVPAPAASTEASVRAVNPARRALRDGDVMLGDII